MTDSERQFVPDEDPGLEFAVLVVHHLAGDLSSGQRDRLNAQLAESAERRDEFVAICAQSRLMATRVGMELALQQDFADLAFERPAVSHSASGDRAPALPQPSVHVGVPRSVFGDLVPGHFASGWPVAYLVATVVFIVGLTIGALVHVSQPGKVVRVPGSGETPNSQSPLPSSSPVVARITGMVDCAWEGEGFRGQGAEAANQKSEIRKHQSPLHLGDRLALRSGLLELTYDTGAKVILQGPATYDVESATGGYLSMGKLTARLEQKSEVRGQRSETSNPQSLIPNPSSSPQSLAPSPFVITTPTALVTDLGTEFGVEVDQEGRTTSHVFRGTVSLRRIGGNSGAPEAEMILHANDSARTERDPGDASRVVMHRLSINPDGFVRRIKEASPVQVLAWFRMGEDEPNAAPGSVAGTEILDHRKRVRLDRYGSPRYSADTAAPDSLISMTFRGENDGECYHTERFPFVPNDYFILEAWTRMHQLDAGMQVIVASGRGAQSGYCLAVVDGRWQGALEGVAWIDSGVPCEIGKWTHLALVCERGKSQLWINGVPMGRAVDGLANMPDGRFTVGGSSANPRCVFGGEIDDVRLSTFIAPFRPEMLLFRKAHPAR